MKNPFDLFLHPIAFEQRGNKLEVGQELYIFDPHLAEALPIADRPIRSWLSPQKFDYLVLSPRRRVTCRPIAVMATSASGRERRVDFAVTIQQVEPGQETRLVGALARNRTPFSKFSAYIGEWVQEFVDMKHEGGVSALGDLAPEDFVPELRTECVAHVTSQALSVLGLRITCQLQMPEDLGFGKVDIDLEHVLVKDDEEPLAARVELQIHPPMDEDNWPAAMERRVTRETLQANVRARALQWFRRDCSLEEFCYNATEVRRRLDEELKQYVEGHLRLQLFAFRVSCVVPFDKDFHQIRTEYQVECTVEPGQTKVPVQHKLLLVRQDIATFRRANVPNLETWIDQLLSNATRTVLFGKKYAEVVVGFEGLKEDIRQYVQAELAKIGFQAKQLITIPVDPEMRKWIDGTLGFDTGTLTFKTRHTEVEYKLSALVRVTFKNFDRVKLYLRPDDSLSGEFRRATQEAAAEVIRKLDPESLYLYFDRPPDNHPNAAPASLVPEEQVRAAIKQRLADEFNAEVKSLNLTPERTELKDLFFAICRPESHSIPLQVDARGSRGETLGFQVDYRVEAIEADGWSRFMGNCYSCRAGDVVGKAEEIISAINKQLTNPTIAIMEFLDPDWLRSVRFDLAEGIRKGGLDKAAEHIARDFGLRIKILAFRRNLSKREQDERDFLREEYDAIRDDIRAKRKRLRELEEDAGPNDERVLELKQSIEELKVRMAEFKSGHDETFAQARLQLGPPPWNKLIPLPQPEEATKPDTNHPDPEPDLDG